MKHITIPGKPNMGISIGARAEAEEVRRQAQAILDEFDKENEVPFKTGDQVFGLLGWASVIDHLGLERAIARDRNEVFYVYPDGRFGNNPVKTAREWTRNAKAEGR